jgi:HK97 family phage portal protein
VLPLNPYRVRVEPDRDMGGLVYWYRFPEGEERRIPRGQIFHLRGKSLNGYTGLSPVAAHREAIGLAIAAERYGAQLFQNGATMGGYFKLPTTMTPEAVTKFRAAIEARHSGFGRAHRPGFLDAGVEWQQTSIPPEDAQFLELRKYQREDICSIFRVPPHMAGDLSRSTNNNIEHQSLEFVTHTLRPWLVRWEQALNRDLLGPYEQPRRFFEFDVNGLLRGDIKARSEAYAKGRQWGWLSVNDIRRWENLNGIGPDGDRYLEPLNMILAGDEQPKQEGA